MKKNCRHKRQKKSLLNTWMINGIAAWLMAAILGYCPGMIDGEMCVIWRVDILSRYDSW